jgi:hypothetical protein
MKFCYCCWVLTKVKGNPPHKDLPKFVKKGRCLKEKKLKNPEDPVENGRSPEKQNALQFLRSQI